MALALDTLLPTPFGWTSVYDLSPESVLVDELGYPCRVTEVSEPYTAPTISLALGWGVSYEHSDPPLVTTPDQIFLTFSHLVFERLRDLKHKQSKYSAVPNIAVMPNNWPTFNPSDIPRIPGRAHDGQGGGSPRQNYARPHTAEDILGTLMYTRKHGKARADILPNHRVPATFSLKTQNLGFYIPPYVLGVLTNYYSVEERYIKIQANLFNHYQRLFAESGVPLEADQAEYRNPYKMLHATIPEEMAERYDRMRKEQSEIYQGPIRADYLRGSEKQRMALLYGLMDRYRGPDHKKSNQNAAAMYPSQDHRLLAQVRELVRSLGWPAYMQWPSIATAAVVWHPLEPPVLLPTLRRRYTIRGKDRYLLERFCWQMRKVSDADPALVRDIAVDSPHKLYTASEQFIPVMSDG